MTRREAAASAFDLDIYVAEMVAAFPPFSDEQTSRLRVLLAPQTPPSAEMAAAMAA